MANTGAVKQPKARSPEVPLKSWIALGGAMLGAFMAVLDIQITNASLKDIQAALGATLEEGSWISTAYLVAEIVVIPLTGWLARVFSTRLYLLTNAIAFMNSTMTHDTGIDELKWSQLVRAIGQPMVFVPLTTLATAGIEKEQAGSASGLFNMMRNLGGSIGIAALATLLIRREQFHSNRLGEGVSPYDPNTQQRIEQLSQYFISRGADLSTAHDRAIASISNLVRREAYIMAFNDCFYFIGFALLLSGLAIIFFKKARATGGAAVH